MAEIEDGPEPGGPMGGSDKDFNDNYWHGVWGAIRDAGRSLDKIKELFDDDRLPHHKHHHPRNWMPPVPIGGGGLAQDCEASDTIRRVWATYMPTADTSQIGVEAAAAAVLAVLAWGWIAKSKAKANSNYARKQLGLPAVPAGAHYNPALDAGSPYFQMKHLQ
jgi:hypothetical protein